jgi:hypothetical protein
MTRCVRKNQRRWLTDQTTLAQTIRAFGQSSSRALAGYYQYERRANKQALCQVRQAISCGEKQEAPVL